MRRGAGAGNFSQRDARVDNGTLTVWKDEIIRGGAATLESVQEMALLQMKYFVRSFRKTCFSNHLHTYAYTHDDYVYSYGC